MCKTFRVQRSHGRCIRIQEHLYRLTFQLHVFHIYYIYLILLNEFKDTFLLKTNKQTMTTLFTPCHSPVFHSRHGCLLQSPMADGRVLMSQNTASPSWPSVRRKHCTWRVRTPPPQFLEH